MCLVMCYAAMFALASHIYEEETNQRPQCGNLGGLHRSGMRFSKGKQVLACSLTNRPLPELAV